MPTAESSVVNPDDEGATPVPPALQHNNQVLDSFLNPRQRTDAAAAEPWANIWSQLTTKLQGHFNYKQSKNCN
jgi:hypothetical protein